MNAEAVRSLVAGKPNFTIEGADRLPYMTRYFLHKENDLKVYVHQFHRGDQDRDLHDHPWGFTSLILVGGYTETTPFGVKDFRSGDVIRHAAADCHMVELFKDAQGAEIETWTLVYVGAKEREWGFHTPDGWMHHRAYFDKKFGKGQWHDADEVLQITNYMED